MIPAGTYPAVVVPVMTEFGELAAQFGKSKEKQTPQVAVAFEILRGPQAGDKITWLGYFTDATVDRTLESIRTAGFTGDDMDKFADQRPEVEVDIVVIHEEYKGKTHAKVAWINRAGGGTMRLTDPMQGSDLRLFSARFKSKLGTLKAGAGKKAEREPRSADSGWSGNDSPDPPPTDPGFGGRATPPGSDDNIPF